MTEEIKIDRMGEFRAKRILQDCVNTLVDIHFDELTTFEKQLLQRVLTPEDFKKVQMKDEEEK
jgi:hypothetical protein